MRVEALACWRRVVAALVVMAAAGAGVVACTETPPPEEDRPPVIVPGRPGEPASTIPPGQASPAPATPPNAEDVRFIQNMIVHHQQAVEMAKLAPDHAADDTVKRLADRISGAQTAEIGAMNSWLRTHGQPAVDPGHSGHGGHEAMPGMATPAQLDALRAARGADFDRLFLELMITHHEGALSMANEVRTKGVDVRAQEIADDVIATQTDEINSMRSLLR